MHKIDFDLVDVPVEFKKITPDDFDETFYTSTIEHIKPNDAGYISDELMPIFKVGIDTKNTVVLNAGTGQGKSKCILDIVSEYSKKSEYIVVFALPYNSLVEQYYNQCKAIVDEKDIFTFSKLNDDKTIKNNKKENKNIFEVDDTDEFLKTSSIKEYKIHIFTVNALLANAGDDSIFQGEARQKHFDDLINTSIKRQKKIVVIFDEIHASIYNFQEDLIYKLWRFKDIIHKNYIISATFNESSKEIIKYLSEFTEKTIQIIESERVLYTEKQGNLHLIINQDKSDFSKNEHLQNILNGFVTENKTFDIIVYSKSETKKLKGRGYFPDEIRSKLNFCYNDIFNPNIIRKYDSSKINIGTNFSTGVNIDKLNHNLVLILPPRTNIKYFTNKGVFTSLYVSLIQSIARLRTLGDIYLIMSEPHGLIEKTLPHDIKINKKIKDVFEKYKTLKSIQYSDIDSEKIQLQNVYSNYIEELESASINIAKSDRAGMNALKYLTPEQFTIEKGENYLNKKFFEGDLSTFVFYLSITNQFSNCQLKSIYHNSEKRYNSATLFEEIKKDYSDYVTSDYDKNVSIPKLSILTGNEIFCYIENYLDKRNVYLDDKQLNSNNLKPIKLIFLLNILTIGDDLKNYSIKEQKDYAKKLYFVSCFQEVLKNDYKGSDEKMIFYFEHYRKWNSLVEILKNSTVESKSKKVLLSKVPNQSFIDKFKELDMQSELNKFIEYDEIVKLNLFPFKDTFSRIIDEKKAINNFYKLLIETFFDVNNKDYQSSKDKGLRYYDVINSFSREIFTQKYFTNMLFSNAATVEDFL